LIFVHNGDVSPEYYWRLTSPDISHLDYTQCQSDGQVAAPSQRTNEQAADGHFGCSHVDFSYSSI